LLVVTVLVWGANLALPKHTQDEAPITEQQTQQQVEETKAAPQPTATPQPINQPKPKPKPMPAGTDTKGKVEVEKLRAYLTNLGSPLAPYSEQIAQSEFGATIIGICYIEQYRCTKAPYNNYWGIMNEAHLRHYATLADGIADIDALLGRMYSRGYNTVEKLNCYYVQPCSANWLNTVKRVKAELQS